MPLRLILLSSLLTLANGKFVSRLTGDELEMACTETSDKRAIEAAFRDCFDNAKTTFNMEKMRMFLEELTPEQSNWCPIFQESMDCLMGLELVSTCFPEGQAEYAYAFHAIHSVLNPALIHLVNGGYDPGYLATCSYWETAEDWLKKSLLKGDGKCSFEESLKNYGLSIACVANANSNIKALENDIKNNNNMTTDDDIIAETCYLTKKLQHECRRWELIRCIPYHVQFHMDAKIDEFTQDLNYSVYRKKGDLEWDEWCVESMLINPRDPAVMPQLEGFTNYKPVFPLYEFNSYSCTDWEKMLQGYKMDECVFGANLTEISRALEMASGQSKSIEDTNFCKLVDKIFHCANETAGVCFNKYIRINITELHMGITAYAVTLKLAAYGFDPGYLAKCKRYDGLTVRQKTDWVWLKSGASVTCKLEDYYRELGLGLLCDIKAKNEFEAFWKKIQYKALTPDDKEEIIAEACRIKSLVKECGTHYKCYISVRKRDWLKKYSRLPVRKLFGYIRDQLGRTDFQWKTDCPN